MNMTEKEESAQLARILALFVATMDNLDAVQEGLTMLGYNTAEEFNKRLMESMGIGQ